MAVNENRLVSIVVPVFNEEWGLVSLYEKIVSCGLDERLEIVFINDGSSDGTRERLEALAERDGRVRLVHLTRNFGIAAALMAGFDHIRGEVIVTIDGNLQYDPADIAKLIARLDEGADICTGWRYSREKKVIRRSLPNRFSNFVISRISGVYLHDCSSSFRALRRATVDDLRLYGDNHRLVPLLVAWQGGRVREEPVDHYPKVRDRAASGGTLKSGVKFLLDLLLVKFFLNYSQKPFYLFGALGLLSFAFSFCAAALALYYKFWGGKTFIETPLPSLFVMSSMMGFVCILVGLLAEIIMRTYFESRGRHIYMVESTRNME